MGLTDSITTQVINIFYSNLMIMKRLAILLVSVLFFSMASPIVSPVPVQATSEDNVKEINFVFLHGFNSNASSLQPLEDEITNKLPEYIAGYGRDNPNISIVADTLNRSYINNVDIETWAGNIANDINTRFAGKSNLVLIGHSMGGKAALYAVAHNIGNIAEKVAMVVTINSPIKELSSYYFVGGDTNLGYEGAQLVLSDQGVLNSVAKYDSSEDGLWVATNKHWLALISAESYPLSTQFDSGGIDLLPRDMDDQIVPISCQYADGADVIYYGEYAHSDFKILKEVADNLADQILSYIFGGNMDFSVLGRAGSFEHKSDLFPGTDYWQDIVGGILADSGTVTHFNESYFKWQQWEDTVGEYDIGGARSTFQTSQKVSFPLFTGITEKGWLDPDNPKDGRIYIKTRAAPRSTVQVFWSVYQQGLLPEGIERNHYEVEIETGTHRTGVTLVSWETSNPRDIRLQIWSQAESPFHWFRVQWRVYYTESRQVKLIDSLPVKVLSSG
ncbi:MAG: alpha/beta hydrolase [Dehalococcoidales bacterium]|nr:alpha/beta hydrolase [Dehalococcoidales bacterium]